MKSSIRTMLDALRGVKINHLISLWRKQWKMKDKLNFLCNAYDLEQGLIVF